MELTQEQKKNIVKWHNALLSGNFQQGTTRLTTIDKSGNEFDCCLGVVCKALGIEGIVENDGVGRRCYGSNAETGVLPIEAYQHLSGSEDPQLRITEELFEKRVMPTNPNKTRTICASSLNDVYDFTFEEIAECIKNTYPEAWSQNDTKR